MGQPRHVFFATIAAGGGHVATATALAEALHAYYPDDFTTRVSDVMAEFGAAALDRRHKASWRALLRRPQLVRIGQRLSDAAPSVTRLSQSLTLDAFARSLARQLNELGPDLVVANHGWLATVFAAARTRTGRHLRHRAFRRQRALVGAAQRARVRAKRRCAGRPRAARSEA
ncbi:MAG TPA: hypothetical protein PLT07_12255 [Trueperaceae bacterium]|nr:hypothetical protein [Trueperaceae bacterium]